MTDEDVPSEAELREARLLADALEHEQRPGRDVASVEDALAVAGLVRASRSSALGELRARSVAERAWPTRRTIRLVVAIAAAAAAVALWLSIRPQGPATLPPPHLELLRTQLAAARPQSEVALTRLESETASYRTQLFAELRHTYGSSR